MKELRNIGFVSTRFAGTDGVSLEALKWAEVLEQDGRRCFWYAGRVDRPPEVSWCVPEAFFNHPENLWINQRVWGVTRRDPLVTRRILEMADYLRETLHEFIRVHDIQMLVLENVSAIPMHLPLGVAVSLLLQETHLPTIGHHHDFYWERTRFSVAAVNEFLDMAFPPRDWDLRHVVINQSAQEELARRKGVASTVIPNVFDFDHPPPSPDEYSINLRRELGLADTDVIILQPTRVVPRKGIGHAINLVQMLGDPKYKLVITHESGDEGLDYRDMLAGFARRAGVDLRFIATRVTDRRQTDAAGRKTFTLWDIYPHADFVTYPSLYEGFGNAFLEALYFRKPILVNRYGNFARDIEPRGFLVPIMEGYLSQEIVAEVRRILEDRAYREAMVEHNYRVARSHFSYGVLRQLLRTLITDLQGVEVPS